MVINQPDKVLGILLGATFSYAINDEQVTVR